MHFHAVVALVAFLGLVHLRIPFIGLVLGGSGIGDQSDIDNCALLLGHDVGLEMRFDHIKYLLAEIVLLQQMAEGQDRGLVRDPVGDPMASD